MSDGTPPGAGGTPDGVPELHWITARLKLAADDVNAHVRLLVDVLVTVLPPDLLVVSRRRSVADRVLGRPGQVASIDVRSPDQVLRLVRHRHGWTAEHRHVVLGVTLSTAPATPAEWMREVATLLRARADDDEQAAEALRRFIGAL